MSPSVLIRADGAPPGFLRGVQQVHDLFRPSVTAEVFLEETSTGFGTVSNGKTPIQVCLTTGASWMIHA